MADPKPPREGNAAIVPAIRGLSRRVGDAEAASGTQRVLAASRLPVLGANSRTVTGIGLAAGWNTYVTVTLDVPPKKTTATIAVIANGAVLDKTSGGVTSLSARVLIGDNPSPAVPGAKDAGASVVNNIFTIAHSVNLTGVSGQITVSVQILPLNPSAFPGDGGNFATATVFAGFAN